MLTPAQSKALDFIRGYIKENGGVSPSFNEIAAALGLKSKSGASRIVVELERRGHIRRLHHRMRALEVLKPGDVDLQALIMQAPAPPIGRPPNMPLPLLLDWIEEYRAWWERTRAGKPV